MNTNQHSAAEAASAELFPALLTIPQVQRYLGASTPFTVYRLINLGRLPVVRIGKRLNVPKQALDEFIQRNQVTRG